MAAVSATAAPVSPAKANTYYNINLSQSSAHTADKKPGKVNQILCYTGIVHYVSGENKERQGPAVHSYLYRRKALKQLLQGEALKKDQV